MPAREEKPGTLASGLQRKLKKESIVIHERTIGKILKKEGLVRKYRVRKIKYKYIKAERKPGELLEIDVKYVPGTIAGMRYFQYTAIDTASRWRHLEVYEEQANHRSILFLKEVMQRFQHKIQAIKTDNGSIFTNYYTSMTKRSDMTVKTIHALDLFCKANHISFTTSLIPASPLRMAPWNAAIGKTKRSSTTRTNSKTSMICKRS